jgi:hypothetical protein
MQEMLKTFNQIQVERGISITIIFPFLAGFLGIPVTAL